ncbi:hypothetical protein [Acaryochloris sp. IP29b_bin.148]|uniref:hypothetical protein n=1 Tax=Acaryochloris sp. IP29b_bin.148 TaxID=2969218 RepID=UPI002604690D|nr:hypothetical protein [Acaryochloris sp. IP29b_bin.148]
MLSSTTLTLQDSFATTTHLPYFQGMHWTDSQAATLLAGMKTVATLQGQQDLHPLSQEMIQATQKHLLQVEGAISALPIIGPETFARDLQEQKHQQLALQLLILMPYLSMQVQKVEVELVNQFAQALQLRPHTLQSLKQVQAGHLRRLFVAYTARSLAELLPG